MGRRSKEWTLSRRVVVLVAFAGVILLGTVAVSAVAVVNLNNSVRQQVERVDPADVAAAHLMSAAVDEETGVRGYLLSGDVSFLQPYDEGITAEQAALRELETYLAGDRPLESDLRQAAAAATAWLDRFARPTIAAAAAGEGFARSTGHIEYGKQLFDRLRLAIGRLVIALSAARQAAAARLGDADRVLIALLGVCLLALLAAFELTWVLIRRWITSPILRLAGDVRQVAAGAFEHPIAREGTIEVRSLASDVDAMRGRILADLAEVESARSALQAEQAALERSNRDLEQFAYVASHDLQEPLRKMSSFSELVLRRHGAGLDDEGREFLSFIAGAARRMQRLIDDIRELSRVGRAGASFDDVDLGEAFQAACAHLVQAIEAAGASVTAGTLPSVKGDQALLVALLQNLLGNSLKFRSADAPVVSVSATLLERSHEWRIDVQDNGIGVAPEHAERVFAMFQRLHPRSQYPGTGIGLAICQRIVEHHGGRIWIDSGSAGGARVSFTLPSPR